MTNGLVYVVVLNWNGWRDTVECLESLSRLDYGAFRIVVCDNGSIDDSLARLRWWATEKFGSESEGRWRRYSCCAAEHGGNLAEDQLFTLIENSANLGYAGGNNVGLSYGLARGDAEFYWLLNNDTVVDAQALSKLVARMSERPTAGLCGSTLRHYEDRTRVQALGGASYWRCAGIAWHIGRTVRGEVTATQESVERKMSYVIGASMFVRDKFVRDVGLLSEDYFLYFEELDWAMRACGRYDLAYAAESVVYHKIGKSIGTATMPWAKSETCDYYTLRNRIVFTKKYASNCLPCIYMVLAVELIMRLLLGRFDLARVVMRVMKEGIRPVGEVCGHVS